MVTLNIDNRNIFSICINYRYAEKHICNNRDFLKAHLAEHLIVVNTCKHLRDSIDVDIGTEKYISGLTNIESSSFQFTAPNYYIEFANAFITSICNHDLSRITQEDFIEQVANVLKEYEYPEHSFQKKCLLFYNYINEFEDVDYKSEMDVITLSDIKDFIINRFKKDNCDIFYCGNHIYESHINVSCWERNTHPLKSDIDYCISSEHRIRFVNGKRNETWLAYRLPTILSLQDYLTCEIVSKVIQIFVTNANRKLFGTNVKNIGTHYTDRCAYSLYSVNTKFKDLSFDYPPSQIYQICDMVKKEYKDRLLINNDSLLNYMKFYKKIYYLTDSMEYQILDIGKAFDSLDANEIGSKFIKIYRIDNCVALQFMEV
jgi:hypothetical protein